MVKNVVHIGCGAGFAGDRADAAESVVDTLIASGAPSFLIFETLAERTLAHAQLRKCTGSGPGYLPAMVDFIRPIVEKCLRHKIPIIGNFGSADPVGAARVLRLLADEAGFPNASIGVVLGDNLLEKVSSAEVLNWAFEDSAPELNNAEVVAVNAYLGAAPIAEALSQGAQIVVTGRVADPSLFLGPLAHSFGWSWDDWTRLAAGTLVGHLLECGAQVSGGYFADPGMKDVPDLATVGYPIAEVEASGSFVIGKASATGGMVTTSTVKEQLLYEIHDPSAYLTPDVILDLTGVQVANVGNDRVQVKGARGRARPERLKGTVCVAGGWKGEGEISYAGPNAVPRAQLAIEVLKVRVGKLAPALTVQFDIIGVSSIFNGLSGSRLETQGENSVDDVRVRMATQSSDRKLVKRAISEVEMLYTTGPAGGGGVRLSVMETLATTSCLIDRDLIDTKVQLF